MLGGVRSWITLQSGQTWCFSHDMCGTFNTAGEHITDIVCVCKPEDIHMAPCSFVSSKTVMARLGYTR